MDRQEKNDFIKSIFIRGFHHYARRAKFIDKNIICIIMNNTNDTKMHFKEDVIL